MTNIQAGYHTQALINQNPQYFVLLCREWENGSKHWFSVGLIPCPYKPTMQNPESGYYVYNSKDRSLNYVGEGIEAVYNHLQPIC